MSQFAYLDGIAHEIADDETILRFAQRNNIDSIPTLCDDKRLQPFGACRVCSVDVALNKDGQKKVVASCHTPVQAGMFIETGNQRFQIRRKSFFSGNLLEASGHFPQRLCPAGGGISQQQATQSHLPIVFSQGHSRINRRLPGCHRH